MSNTHHDFSQEERARYSRHLLLPEVGLQGQRALRRARVLLVGAGGLGSPIALYLAAAGIGRIGLVDMDVVELSNLQRQVIHRSKDVGTAKTASAARAIQALNPAVDVGIHECRFAADNALRIASGYDVIIDATDNFPARYLVNDVAVLQGKPAVYGSILQFEGQASVYLPGLGPCYRCLFPEPPAPDLAPNCAEGGVLGVLPGIIGTIQAAEAIKLVLGCGTSLAGRLLLFDALAMRFREMATRRDPRCRACSGQAASIEPASEGLASCAGHEMVPGTVQEVTPHELATMLSAGDVTLLDVRTPQEHALGQLPAATLMPLGDLEQRAGELDPRRPVVVYCRSGIRGLRAADLLRQRGFAGARNLMGGLLAWARDIDPGVPID